MGAAIGGVLSYGWVRLDTESRYLVESGFSGGGVWCPDYGAVIALVGQANERGDAQALTLHRADLVLPNEKITALGRRPLRPEFASSELVDGYRTGEARDLLVGQDGRHHELRQVLELFWREGGDTGDLLRGHETGHPTQVDVADAVVAGQERGNSPECGICLCRNSVFRLSSLLGEPNNSMKPTHLLAKGVRPT